MKKPDFFLVGAPKCGTTAMIDYLTPHPQIFIPNGKEFHFFGRDLMRKRYRFSEDEYLALFAPARDDQITGESSVYYLYSETAAEEIHAFNPNAKILVMLRNPADMIYSCHSHVKFGGLEEISSFEDALAAEERRAEAADRLRAAREAGLRAERLADDQSNDEEAGWLDPFLYHRLGLYTDQVARYFDTFGRDNVHVIVFDDFKRDTPGVYRETLEFLGVDPSFETDFRVVNAAKTPRSQTLQKLTMKPPGLLRKLARTFIPPTIRHRVLLGTLIRLNAKEAPNPPMDPALRKELQAWFGPDVARLSALLERDLTGWSTSEPPPPAEDPD